MKTESKKLRVNPIFGILFGISGVMFFVLFLKWQQHRYKMYTDVEKETEISGVIQRLWREHGALLIQFKDSSKFEIYQTYNQSYEQSDIFMFGEIGDSIFKKANNDTVFIFRSGKEYQFYLQHQN
jgi:hypothetical protein